VQWKTKDSNLDVTKYYRIKVLVEGASVPFGVADIDPVLNMKEFKNAHTGEVIPLNDDSTLPIKFRIEHGGGAALCATGALCTSKVVTNNSPTGFQIVTVDNGAGAVAGVKFPNGWLPANGPQSVVVTVAQVDLGATDPATGAETTQCHATLPLQQFPGCFRFTTTPTLPALDESGRQFAQPVTAAVCYTLYGTGDPREKFAEMYASGPNEPPHALEDASDAGILSPAARNCSASTQVIGATGGNELTRFASTSWRSVKSKVGQFFGVKTAYAIDLGLGGFMSAFSNVGPALSATIEPITSTDTTLRAGTNLQAFVRIVGSNHHDGQHQNATGLGGLSVQFQLADGSGAIGQLGDEATGATQLSVVTNTNPIDPESPVSGGGYAAVNWALPSTPGVYHLTASGPTLGGPVTFNVTVISTAVDLGLLPGTAGSVALGINDAGHVVGYSYNNTNPFQETAFIWRDGQMASLGTFAGQVAQPTGINLSDEVVGFYGDQTLGFHAFRWKDGTLTTLEAFPGSLGGYAVGINSSGQIVGTSDMIGAAARSWIWQNGAYTDLGLPAGSTTFRAVAINDAGQVVGTAASPSLQSSVWIWQNGTFTALPSSAAASALAINDAGVVVGIVATPEGEHAARWQNGVMTDLGHLPGDTNSEAEGINSDGQIVGISYIPGSETNSFVAHAFLWDSGKMINLGALATNGDFAEAIAINRSGQIAGQSIGSGPGARATLWQAPIP
jgi:probable HAF family extracellular repeat protein